MININLLLNIKSKYNIYRIYKIKHLTLNNNNKNNNHI